MAENSIHDSWLRVTDGFTEVARRVPDDRWTAPAPPEGWTTVDVVRHLVEWVPSFLASGSDVVIEPGPDVDEDPVGAWTAFVDQMTPVLADRGVHERAFSHPRAGDHALDDAIDTFILNDVFMHTWDLAKGAGLDVQLDPVLAKKLADGIAPIADVLAQSGQYGPAVPVGDDASDQDRLIALIGRDPNWVSPAG